MVVLENSEDFHEILVGFAFPGRKSVNREGQFRRGRSGGFGGSGENSRNSVNFLRILRKSCRIYENSSTSVAPRRFQGLHKAKPHVGICMESLEI